MFMANPTLPGCSQRQIHETYCDQLRTWSELSSPQNQGQLKDRLQAIELPYSALDVRGGCVMRCHLDHIYIHHRLFERTSTFGIVSAVLRNVTVQASPTHFRGSTLSTPHFTGNLYQSGTWSMAIHWIPFNSHYSRQGTYFMHSLWGARLRQVHQCSHSGYQPGLAELKPFPCLLTRCLKFIIGRPSRIIFFR
jgi:hypothetical protein